MSLTELIHASSLRLFYKISYKLLNCISINVWDIEKKAQVSEPESFLSALHVLKYQNVSTLSCP